MRMAKDMVTGRLYCRTAICTSANIVTGLDTVKVSTCSKTVLAITAIGETDANTVKGSFGILTERDTKVRARMYKNRIRIRLEEVGHVAICVCLHMRISIQLFLYRTSEI